MTTTVSLFSFHIMCQISEFLYYIYVFLKSQEIKRIESEHLDDSSAIIKNRVKGSLKVTRAFGAGFLKQVLDLASESTIYIIM